jgi:hypothetical protein
MSGQTGAHDKVNSLEHSPVNSSASTTSTSGHTSDRSSPEAFPSVRTDQHHPHQCTECGLSTRAVVGLGVTANRWHRVPRNRSLFVRGDNRAERGRQGNRNEVEGGSYRPGRATIGTFIGRPSGPTPGPTAGRVWVCMDCGAYL